MNVMLRMAFVVVLLAVMASAIGTHPPVLAQSPQMHVHHVHLNSVDPKAAAAYYPKAFAESASATTFNGYEAVKTGNVYLLFTKVSRPS